MKNKPLLILLLLFGSYTASSQAIFDLEPSQSMSITGKGPGQDAAINPYDGGNSVAVIQNIGKNTFDARVQYNGEIIKIVAIPVGQTKEVNIPKGYELYFDTLAITKAKLLFKKGKE